LASRRPLLMGAQLELDCAAASGAIHEVHRHDCLEDAYDIKEALGQGSMGKVFHAFRRTDNEQVALKVVRTNDEEVVEIARKEFDLLQRISHQNIITAIDFFTTADRAVLVMSFFEGESLYDRVRRLPKKRLSEEAAHALFLELLNALDYLHQHRIVHRDVKPHNVLVAQNLENGSLPRLKLIDFNIARYLPEGGALSPNCTPQYAAPEVRRGGSPSEASDIWGAGLCLCMMLSGHCPRVENIDTEVSLECVRKHNVSTPCWMMLRQCLAIEHSMRPAAMTLLKSTWILYGRPRHEELMCAEGCKSRSTTPSYKSVATRCASAASTSPSRSLSVSGCTSPGIFVARSWASPEASPEVPSSPSMIRSKSCGRQFSQIHSRRFSSPASPKLALLSFGSFARSPSAQRRLDQTGVFE